MTSSSPRTGGVLAALLALLVAPMVVLGVPAPAHGAPYPWEHDSTVDLLQLPTNHSPAPTVADWDGDGDDDLVVGLRSADQHGGVAVALRDEAGNLGELTTVLALGRSAIRSAGRSTPVLRWVTSPVTVRLTW